MKTTATRIAEAAATHAKARDFLGIARDEYSRLFNDESIPSDGLSGAKEAYRIANEKERAADAFLQSLCRDSAEHDKAMRAAL